MQIRIQLEFGYYFPLIHARICQLHCHRLQVKEHLWHIINLASMWSKSTFLFWLKTRPIKYFRFRESRFPFINFCLTAFPLVRLYVCVCICPTAARAKSRGRRTIWCINKQWTELKQTICRHFTRCVDALITGEAHSRLPQLLPQPHFPLPPPATAHHHEEPERKCPLSVCVHNWFSCIAFAVQWIRSRT